MKRNRVRWMAVVAGLLILSAGLLWGEEPQQPRVRIREAPAVRVVASPQEGAATFLAISGRGRLGVSVAEIDVKKAQELKLPGVHGALVTEVEKDSPAEKAGFRENDVIVEFDGERVRSASQLQRLVRETPANREVGIRVSREGQMVNLQAKLEETGNFARLAVPRIRSRIRPRMRFEALPEILALRSQPRLGISGDELTGQLAEHFGVRQGKGVLIREVSADSAAEKAGLKAGDVIVKVGDEEIATVSDLREALREAAKAEEEEVTVNLTIVRDRREQTVPVTVEKPERPAEYRWSGRLCGEEDCEFDVDIDPDEWRDHLLFVQPHLERSLKELQENLRDQLERIPEYLEDWDLRWQDRGGDLRLRLEEALRAAGLRRI